MNFQKFSSIENSYRALAVNDIVHYGFDKGEWVVSEKCHGSNFSFWYNGQYIRVASRSHFLDITQSFYGSTAVIAKYQEAIKRLWEELDSRGMNPNTLAVYGEICGGAYPHPDVKPVKGATRVQKGIYYHPGNEFYAFDIRLNGDWLNDDLVHDLCAIVGLVSSEPLFRGSFEDCLAYSNEYQTTIPAKFGLPPIEDNVCEGNVLRPVIPQVFPSGSRVILKNKNQKWSEKSKESKAPKPLVKLSDNGERIRNTAASLITENRLRNVLSKIGPVSQKEFGKLLGALSKDVMTDLPKESDILLDTIDKAERKIISKMVNRMAADVIRPNFVNIIDGNF